MRGLGVPEAVRNRYKYVRDAGPVGGRIIRPEATKLKRTDRTIGP